MTPIDRSKAGFRTEIGADRAGILSWRGGQPRCRAMVREQPGARLGAESPPARALGVPRGRPAPGAPRPEASVQADRRRCRLGGPAAGHRGAHLHAHAREARRRPERRHRLPGVRPRGPRSAGPSCPRGRTRRAESLVDNRELVTKAYFPRILAPSRRRPARASSTWSRACSCSGSAMVVTRHRARARAAHAAALDRGGVRRRARGRSLARGAQRALPRRALHARLHPADLVLRQPRRVPELAHRRAGALAVRAQPDGRRHRRLPVGARRRPSHRRPPISCRW